MFPMPVQALMDHPEFHQMSAAACGMTVRLVFHYWRTECAELPSKGELYCVCRPHRRTWASHYPQMMRIFNEIRPGLDRYFAERSARKSIIQSVQANQAAKRRGKSLAEKAPPRADPFDRLPTREAERYQRVLTPEERGPRRRVAQTRLG